MADACRGRRESRSFARRHHGPQITLYHLLFCTESAHLSLPLRAPFADSWQQSLHPPYFLLADKRLRAQKLGMSRGVCKGIDPLCTRSATRGQGPSESHGSQVVTWPGAHLHARPTRLGDPDRPLASGISASRSAQPVAYIDRPTACATSRAPFISSSPNCPMSRVWNPDHPADATKANTAPENSRLQQIAASPNNHFAAHWEILGR